MRPYFPKVSLGVVSALGGGERKRWRGGLLGVAGALGGLLVGSGGFYLVTQMV